jgi:TolB-like protein
MVKMKKLGSLWFVVFCLCFSYIMAVGQTKITVAVLDFEAKNIAQETADAVADILSTELFNTNRFNVVERTAIAKILEEQKLQMTGITDMSKAAEIGKVLNVEKIMTGSVSKLGNTIIINTRLVDVETGALELAQNTKSLRGEDGLPAAIAELVKQIAQQVNIEGSIIKINGKTVLVDIGKNYGVKVGQQMSIIRIGDYVTDLGGSIIGNTEDLVGLLEISKVNPDYSEAQIVQVKIEPRLGDKVRFVTTATVIPKEKKDTQKTDTSKDKKPVEPPPVF